MHLHTSLLKLLSESLALKLHFTLSDSGTGNLQQFSVESVKFQFTFPRPMTSPPKQSFKVVIVGSSGVGKTAMMQRLVDDVFTEDAQSTVGVEFKSYVVPVEDRNVKLQIWDTAGQERFKSVSKAYLRDAVGALLVYDVASQNSFDDLGNWLTDLRQLCHASACILLIGNKCDLEQDRQVGSEAVQRFASLNRLDYLETSARTGFNVTETFTRLAYGIANRVSGGQIELIQPAAKPFTLDPPQESFCNC
jgi:small GTP-binding protein